MRVFLFIITPVVLLLSIVGCQGNDAETEALEAQAIALHDSLVVIESQVRNALAQVTSETTTHELATPLLDSLNAIQADLEAWSSYVIEPPGAHEEHDHSHDHDHSHEPPPDITPQQMVEVQQALLTGIGALKVRFDQLNIDITPTASEDSHGDEHDDEHDDEHEHMHRHGIDHDH